MSILLWIAVGAVLGALGGFVCSRLGGVSGWDVLIATMAAAVMGGGVFSVLAKFNAWPVDAWGTGGAIASALGALAFYAISTRHSEGRRRGEGDESGRLEGVEPANGDSRDLIA